MNDLTLDPVQALAGIFDAQLKEMAMGPRLTQAQWDALNDNVNKVEEAMSHVTDPAQQMAGSAAIGLWRMWLSTIDITDKAPAAA